MKNTLKLISIVLFIFVFTYSSFGRVVGSIINSIPTVTLSSSDFLNEIEALEDDGFTNISIVEMHLTYTVSTGGYFFFTFSYNAPNDTTLYKQVTMLECIYDSGNNEFEVVSGGLKTSCRSTNCNGCIPQGTTCTSCDPPPFKTGECEKTVSNIIPGWNNNLWAVICDLQLWLAN